MRDAHAAAGLCRAVRIRMKAALPPRSKPMDVINPDRCDTTGVAEWLIGGARSAPQPHEVVAQCSERLIGCGIPLWRVAVFVRTLHPNIPGRAFVWRPGEEVQMRPADFELFESEEFRT